MLHVYDWLVRVPLILHGHARLPPGRSFDRMVRQPDILPTLCELAGVPREAMPAGEGRSFLPLLEGQPWEPAPAFLSVSGLPADLELRGVRTERFKFTYGPQNDELPRELYDLREDPGELINLASDRPEVCSELRAIAERFAAGERRATAVAAPASVDEQRRVEEHLKALGYLE